MRLSPTLLTLAASLLTPTTARITGFSAPSTIVPGASIQIHLLTSNYIQRVQNVAVAFGITPVENYYPGSLGTFVGEKGLGPGMLSYLCYPNYRCRMIGWPIANACDLYYRTVKHYWQHHRQREYSDKQTLRRRDAHGGAVLVVWGGYDGGFGEFCGECYGGWGE